MTLQEALEKLKDMEAAMTDRNQFIQDGWSENAATAIATILNAVVKGELVNDR